MLGGSRRSPWVWGTVCRRLMESTDRANCLPDSICSLQVSEFNADMAIQLVEVILFPVLGYPATVAISGGNLQFLPVRITRLEVSGSKFQSSKFQVENSSRNCARSTRIRLMKANPERERRGDAIFPLPTGMEGARPTPTPSLTLRVYPQPIAEPLPRNEEPVWNVWWHPPRLECILADRIAQLL